MPVQSVDLSVDDINIIRNTPADQGVGLMQLAVARGWNDADIARHYNSQFGTGANWTEQSVATHRAWLTNSGLMAPNAPAQTVPAIVGDYLMLGGKRYTVTPA